MPLRVGNQEVILRRGNLEVPALFRANFRAFRSSFPPVITQNPTGLTVTAGNTATFTSSATGKPDPTIQWQISTNNGSSWSDISGATGNTYTTSSLTASDNDNEYRAVWTNEVGSATSTAASVNVQTPPVVTTHPSNTTIISGQTATFSAAASGNPTPTVQWQVSTNGGSTWSNIGGATGTSYSFTTALSNSGYQYRAVFTNAVGFANTNAATLTVATVPAVTSHPASQTANAGSSVTFTAAASGNPTPTVQWQVSTNGGSTWSNISGATSTSYSFATASGNNGYQYRAVFTNSAGSATTNAATLTVEFISLLANPGSSPSVVSGSYTVLSASFSGSPAPSVQWQQSTDGGSTWSNISGATQAAYQTPSLSPVGATFRYRCVASNSAGTVVTDQSVVTVVGVVSATGGTVTTYELGGTYYRAHTFTNAGESTLDIATANAAVDYLIVGGGGGGGGVNPDYCTNTGSGSSNCGKYGRPPGGGGGAGGMLDGSLTPSAGTHTVTVGSGGTGGHVAENLAKGGDSSLFNLVAYGGGGGSSWDRASFRKDGQSGGSGGGVGRDGVAGSGTEGQGYPGSRADPPSSWMTVSPCTSQSSGVTVTVGTVTGGGGGAGGPGYFAGPWYKTDQGHNGGNGRTSNITGVNKYYAGGGGGSADNDAGQGGAGGGGKGGGGYWSRPSAGTPGTGGGGGGSTLDACGDPSKQGQNGGSGIVVVRYVVAHP